VTTGDAAPPSPHGDAMAPPRQRNSERATTAGGSPRAGAPASLDDALRRIDALEAENEALAAEIGALKKSATARADAARRADGSSPSAGRARDRERSELEEPAFMTMTMTSLLARVRLLEEREAARVPILERFVEEAPDVFNRHVLPRLDDGDLAVLAMVNQKMREFVFASPVGDVRDVAAVRRQLARVRNFVGSVGRMAWAKERGCPWDKDTFECIAEFWNVEVAKWAKERGCVSELDVHPDLCYKAASGGQLEMLQWLRANGAPWDGFRWNEKTCAVAAEGGHLEVLQWARANGAPWDYMTCAHAARGGHLEVLQWARANGAPWDESTCAYAAEGGHLEVLQWARANGAPWDEMTCRLAAYGGHLEVLQWARANGCPWNVFTCACAAKGGHLEVLQWARANGAPWNKETCYAAVEGGHLEVLKWARANGAPWDDLICINAALAGHLEVLKWARANGAPWDERTCAEAAKGGHLEVLQWARDNGAPWDKETCMEAVRGGHLEVLKWARANGCPWDKKHCADRAVNRPEVFEWIRQSVPLTQKIEYLRSYEEKKSMLMDLVHAVKGLTLVFVETETGVDQLEDWLSREGFPSTSIHGYRTQQVREYALNSFRSGRTPILVTTDVATLGLDDVPHVSHVINFDLPSNIDGYVHRIGLTARAGNKGLATAFFTDKDAGLARPLRRILSEEVQEVPDFLYKFISYPKGWSWLDDSLQ